MIRLCHDPGVVVQHVNPAILLEGLCNRVLHAVLVSDVAGVVTGDAARCPYGCYRLFRGGFVDLKPHFGAFFCKQVRGGASHAAARARNDTDFVLQSHPHFPPVSWLELAHFTARLTIIPARITATAPNP